MRRLSAAGLLLLLALAGCGVDEPAGAPSPSVLGPAGPVVTAPAEPEPDPQPSSQEPHPEPSTVAPGLREAYLAELRDIDPRLAEDEALAVTRGEDTCEDLGAGEYPDAQLVARVRQRFSADDLQLDDEQARRVIDGLRRTLC